MYIWPIFSCLDISVAIIPIQMTYCRVITCTQVMLDTVVVNAEEREDGQSLHCQLEIDFEAVLAFKAGSEENARMKEAEASRDCGSLETSSRMLAASAHLKKHH